MKNSYLVIWNAVLTVLLITILIISFINRNEIDKLSIEVYLLEETIDDNTKRINQLIGY